MAALRVLPCSRRVSNKGFATNKNRLVSFFSLQIPCPFQASAVVPPIVMHALLGYVCDSRGVEILCGFVALCDEKVIWFFQIPDIHGMLRNYIH